MTDEKLEKKVDNEPLCYSPFFEMTIFADGNVAPCCFSDQEKIEEIENIRNKEIREVWYGKKFETLREKMLTGIFPEICKKCSISQSEMSDLKILFKKNYKGLTENERYIPILEDLLTKLSKKNKEQRKRIESIRNKFKGKIEDLKAERDRLKEENQEKDKDRTSLKNELNGLEAEKEMLESEVERINGERDRLENELNGLEAEKEMLESEVERINGERDRLENELNEIKSSIFYKIYKKIKNLFQNK